jgi:hypothetical protein
MSALSIEHSSAAYRLDDIVYGMVAAGVVGWSAMEYGLQLFALLVAFPAFWLWGVYGHGAHAGGAQRLFGLLRR